MNAPADWNAPRKATQKKRTFSQQIMRYVAIPLLLLSALMFAGMYFAAQHPDAWYTHASRIAFGYLLGDSR